MYLEIVNRVQVQEYFCGEVTESEGQVILIIFIYLLVIFA